MANKSLKEVLDDVQGYPDTLTVKFGDNDIPLGSLRQLRKTDTDSLASAMSSLEAQRSDLTRQQEHTLKLATDAQHIQDQLTERLSRLPNPSAQPDSFDTDPFYEPVRGRVRTLVEKYDKAISELNAAKANLETMQRNQASIWAEDRWDQQYDRILSSVPEDKRSTMPKRDELLKFALENQLVDRHKIPSVELAWAKRSEGDRLAQIREQGRQAGIEEERNRRLVGSVPRPSTNAAGAPPSGGANGFSDWNDLTEAALRDPEIARLIGQTGIGVPS